MFVVSVLSVRAHSGGSSHATAASSAFFERRLGVSNVPWSIPQLCIHGPRLVFSFSLSTPRINIDCTRVTCIFISLLFSVYFFIAIFCSAFFFLSFKTFFPGRKSFCHISSNWKRVDVENVLANRNLQVEFQERWWMHNSAIVSDDIFAPSGISRKKNTVRHDWSAYRTMIHRPVNCPESISCYPVILYAQ